MRGLLVVTLGAVLTAQSVVSGVELNNACFDMVQDVMGTQLGHLVPCINELGLAGSPKERASSYNCVMKCVLSKGGTLTPEGKISVLKAVGFILEQFPNEYIEKALTEISKCQKYAALQLADPGDKGCTKMRPLITCGVDFIFNLCK